MSTNQMHSSVHATTLGGEPDATAVESMRILIVDDHALFRQGLAMLVRDLYPDATIIEAASASDAITIAKSQPELRLILMDLELPEGRCFATIEKILSLLPEAVLAVISESDQMEYVAESYRAGAKGYIAKSSTSEILRHALPLILAGETYIPSIATAMLTGTQRFSEIAGNVSPDPDAPALTPRQREILVLMAHGLSNRDIADRLGMLEGTVKVHVKGVLQKLGVKNRTHAVIKGFRLGLVPSSILQRNAGTV